MPIIETLVCTITEHVGLLNSNNIIEKDVNLICPICLNEYDNDAHKESLEHVLAPRSVNLALGWASAPCSA
jgi:dihydroorotase